MARRPTLGGGSLNPFGGAGVDFGAFDIVNTNRESELILTRVEVAWNAGTATDAQYISALKAYAGTLTANTSERLNADARVASVQYTVERQVLASKVDSGQKTVADLLAYDKGKLAGISHDSQEYRQRLDTYQSTQSRLYNDLETAVVNRYNKGQMTTAQLNAWYVARKNDPNLAGNSDITKAVGQRIDELGTRLVSEKDSKVISDYQAGKVSPSSFISYATHARSRYTPGTTDFKDWSDRITQAHDQSLETALLYRYNLAQQYAQLAKFVASSKAPSGSAGGTRTSHSTRTVLGADGQWHSVTTTKTTATPGHGPSKSELAAYAKRQLEVADAKRQMAQIASKVAGVGGFVSTPTMINYYTAQRGKFAKGSDEWYAIQGKLDSLNDTLHQETVLKSEGIRISYPKTTTHTSSGSSSGHAASGHTTGGGGGSSAPAARSSDTAGVGLDSFMTAIAHVESGGRYTAVNKSSGAFGKYQIMPSVWPGWAAKYLGDAHAAQTPANQEKVARGKFQDLYKWLGDWRAVAHWWLTGGSDKAGHLNPASWSGQSTRYVNNVMAGLGKGPVSSSTLAASARTAGAPASQYKAPGSASVGYQSPTPKPATTGAHPTATGQHSTSGGAQGLRVVTGHYVDPRTGASHDLTKPAGFPSGLDSSAFTKFYAQYDAAFKSGATEFSVDTGKGVIHYFIGADPTARRDGMRQLDDLRIQLYHTKMVDYAGSPSEITAANQFDGAVEDSAKHEIMILDTATLPERQMSGSHGTQNTSVVPEKSANPIAAGLAHLDKTLGAINDHITAADAAMKRGDLTTAYTQYQMAADMRASADATLARFSAAAQNDIAAIEKAYGVNRDEALGSDLSKQIAADMDRLNNFGTELETGLGKGTPGLTELQSVIKKDDQGNPVFDQNGPAGQLLLSDGYHFEVQPSGEVKAVATPTTGYDPNTRQQSHDIEGMSKITYLSGGSTVTAYAKYKAGTVGYIEMGDGSRIPITGKTITRRKADGTDELWVENPFRPGQWSSTPIVMTGGAAMTGLKVIPGPNGSQVFQFNGLATDANGNKTQDGYTYTMQLDPATNTYMLHRSKPGGLFSAPVEEDLGSMAPGSFGANIFDNSGFQRDLNGLTDDELAFSNMATPFVGGTPAQYKQWRNNFQLPGMPTPTANLTPGQLSARIRAGAPMSRNIDLADVDPTYKARVTPTLTPAQLSAQRRYDPSLSRNIDLADVPKTAPKTTVGGNMLRSDLELPAAKRPVARPLAPLPKTAQPRNVDLASQSAATQRAQQARTDAARAKATAAAAARQAASRAAAAAAARRAQQARAATPRVTTDANRTRY